MGNVKRWSRYGVPSNWRWTLLLRQRQGHLQELRAHKVTEKASNMYFLPVAHRPFGPICWWSKFRFGGQGRFERARACTLTYNLVRTRNTSKEGSKEKQMITFNVTSAPNDQIPLSNFRFYHLL